jgi:hypothetical protein
MLWVRGWIVAVSIAGALTTSAWAQNEPPCRLGSFPFAYAGGTSVPAKTSAPFSATVKWTFDRQLPDGNAIHAVEWTRQARDSAGRTRAERAQGCYRGEDGQLHARTDVSIYDPTTKTTTYWTTGGSMAQNVAYVTHQPAPVASPARAARPAPTSDEQAAALARQKLAAAERPPQGEVRNISLGTMTIGGVSAEGSRSVHTIPAGLQGNEQAFEIMREYWVSKDLSLTVKSVFDNPMTGRSTFELQDISLQEPDASLFQIPAGYTVKDQSPVQASR